MTEQLLDPLDLDHLLQAIRDGLLLQPAHTVAGSVKIVIESEVGEPLHVVQVDARRPSSNKLVLPMRLLPAPFAELLAATSSSQAQAEGDGQERGLLQRCNKQQQRIAELEQQLRQVQQELQRSGPAAPLSPALSTTDDDNSSRASSSSSNTHSPRHSSSGETDENDRETHDNTVMTDDADDESPASSASPPASHVSITIVRKSERLSTSVDRWSPGARHEAESARRSSSDRKRKGIKRCKRSHRNDDDGKHRISSDMNSMDVDSANDDDDNDDDAAEVATLIVKLREGYDRRHNVALDSLSKESILSLRQQVLNDHVASTISGQITSLITTSTSLRMVGYYLRAILAHRLKSTSQKCYKRLARDTLGVKSPADIAAYPALYELVQHHYPTLASAAGGVEVWLESPIFTADITWTEWKRYLTKQGRPIVDAALQRFKDTTAPFQDWLQLGWVEVYDDDELGQGVRALRDIHMPVSKAKEAQRDVAASVSVVAADLHCADPECVLDKDAAGGADTVYLVQLDRHRVFNARHHWVGKINHLPDRLCNLKLSGTGKLVQTRAIEAGEALTFDYGVDYWVYQLSGLELSEWSVGNTSVQSNRGTLNLFDEMHDTVQDYTALFGCDWVERRPAAWSELEKEVWMANLAEYMENASK